MVTHKGIEAYILSMPGTWLDYPFGKDVAVYKLNRHKNPSSNETELSRHANTDSTDLNTAVADSKNSKMFALIAEGKEPLQISLKCDPQLSEVLREKYESVMPGYHLNKKHWNTIVLTGQLSWEEVQDLIRHSYELVLGGNRG